MQDASAQFAYMMHQYGGDKVAKLADELAALGTDLEDLQKNQVLWKGYPITETSWEPESHLCNAPQILEEYLCHIAAETSAHWRQQNRGSWRTT